MIEARPFDSLGRFDNDWLNARYHFSFANYHDPRRMNWGALRVWNDDQIRAKSGFAPHSHADMEIITYVRQGAITHEDSLGNRGRTEAGGVQVMSAGAGVTHAEYNLEDEETRIFQIWLLPKVRGGAPSWGSRAFPTGERAGALVTLASGFAADQAAGALPIRQDARVLAATLRPGEQVSYALDTDRKAYAVLARGSGQLGDVALNARDGAAIGDVRDIVFTAEAETELLLIDAP